MFSMTAGRKISLPYWVLLNFLTRLPIWKEASVLTIDTGSEQNLKVIGIR